MQQYSNNNQKSQKIRLNYFYKRVGSSIFFCFENTQKKKTHQKQHPFAKFVLIKNQFHLAECHTMSQDILTLETQQSLKRKKKLQTHYVNFVNKYKKRGHTCIHIVSQKKTPFNVKESETKYNLIQQLSIYLIVYDYSEILIIK